MKALAAAARLGTSYGAPSPLEVELAELVRRRMPSLERVRFVSSGTEAAMSAIRVARAATRREKIIKFEGCYHGHADSFLVQAGSGALTLGVPTSPGVTRGAANDTLLASYNDIASVHRVFDANRDQIAALIVEPIAGNMGVVPPADGFLRALREVCDAHGTLLVFDEVISGFRAGPGGAQALANVKPDLTCLGKIIGGGLPVGAYGGRADLMELVSPAGPVYQAGTLSGNPLAMTAGLWCLAHLKPALYRSLAALTVRLAAGLADAARDAGVAVQINAVGSLLTPFFTDRPGPRLRLRDERRHRPIRAFLPRHADARDLPAAVTIRGVVPVGSAHDPRRRQDHCRRPGGIQGSELIAAPAATPERGPGIRAKVSAPAAMQAEDMRIRGEASASVRGGARAPVEKVSSRRVARSADVSASRAANRAALAARSRREARRLCPRSPRSCRRRR